MVMRRADIGRGDGSRRNDAVEVGGVASVRGSGAAASAGLEGSGVMSCESGESAVSGVSHATGESESAGGGVMSKSARQRARKAAKLSNGTEEVQETASDGAGSETKGYVARANASKRKNKWMAGQTTGPEEQ